MRIRYVTQYDPSLSPIEANRKMLLHLSNALVSEGHRVDMEVIYGPPRAERAKHTGGANLTEEVGLVLSSPYRSALGLLGSDQDIVVVQSTLGTQVLPVIRALMLRGDVPHLEIILCSHLKYFWTKKVLGRPLTRWYGNLRHIGVYTRFQAEILNRHLPGSIVHILPPVVEDPPLEREPSQIPTVLYVGSFDRMRGTDLLLQAAARLQKTRPEVRIRMAIRDGRLVEAGEMIRGMGLSNVEVLGQVDVWEELSRAWLFVYPFQGSNPPSFPLSIMEALKMGVPVLATRKASIPEILPDHSLFDGGSDGLFEGILRQLDSPHAPPCPERFLFENAVREHLRVFESIASGWR